MAKRNELSLREKIEMLDNFKKQSHSVRKSLLNTSKSKEAILMNLLTIKKNSSYSGVRYLVMVKSQKVVEMPS